MKHTRIKLIVYDERNGEEHIPCVMDEEDISNIRRYVNHYRMYNDFKDKIFTKPKFGE